MFMYQDDEEMREEVEQCVVKVTPWKNIKEFTEVYKMIFGEDSNEDTRRKAYEKMTIWHMRRLTLTPASILSTLAILEVQLKDINLISSDDLKSMYSSACTKFLNYMTSIMIKKQFKSMYVIVKELGLDSFIVDLRHLCTHGQVMPSLDVLQRSAEYCLNWLKDFYWDRQIQEISNVKIMDIRPIVTEKYSKTLSEQFKLYDTITEALHKGYNNVEELNTNLDPEKIDRIILYSRQIKQNSLKLLANKSLGVITNSLKFEISYKEIICSVITKGYLIESPETKKSKTNLMSLTKLHQNFFQTMAKYGLNKSIFEAFVLVFENQNETTVRRKGAVFWANKIVQGFIILKKLKIYKTELNINLISKLELNFLNLENTSDILKKFYIQIGANTRDSLLFSDTLKRPQYLKFSRDYIFQRISNVNSFSLELIKNCFDLVEPELSESDINMLNKLTKIYLGFSLSSSVSLSDKENIIYTLQEHVLKGTLPSDVIMGDETECMTKKFGLWSQSLDNVDWPLCPLGRLPF